jgi:hypothetical protein
MNKNLRERLLSEDIELQTCAIREAADTVGEILKTTVQGILSSRNPLLTCDALSVFGSMLNRCLEEQLRRECSKEVRLSISLLLVRPGSKEGIDCVMEELPSGGELQFFAASTLANAGVSDAGADIVERLRFLTRTSRFRREEAPKFQALFNALRALRIGIPEEIKADLTIEGVPKEISGAVSE